MCDGTAWSQLPYMQSCTCTLISMCHMVQLMCKQTSEPSGNTEYQYRHTLISGVMDVSKIKLRKLFILPGRCNLKIKFPIENSGPSLHSKLCYSPVCIRYTGSMEHGPSWEANQSSFSHKFPAFYGTRRFITSFTRAVPFWSHTNPSHAPLPPIPLLEGAF